MKQIIDNPFTSFWMAGFECTDQLNAQGERVDFLKITSHLELVSEDYAALFDYDIKVVREGVRWSQTEYEPYCYDFSTVGIMVDAAKKQGIQQIWDLCHFGFPDDLSPLHPHFSKRFAAFCKAFAIFYQDCDVDGPLIVTPVNEVSFISWLGGDVAGTSPYCFHNGWQVKYAYMRAYIAGIEAIKSVVPEVRILTTEPLVNVTHRLGATEQQKMDAAFHHQHQFQVLDMLSGRICPELGGKEEYLDLLGFNYYYDNQWTIDPHEVIGWNDPEPNQQYKPITELLNEVYKRYNRPIVLSETSHPGEDRPKWLHYIANQASEVLHSGIPLWGICLYPIIDRPDWDNLTDWHHAGIWDHDGDQDNERRVLHRPSSEALLRSQEGLRTAIQQNNFKGHHEVSIRFKEQTDEFTSRI